MRVIRRTFQGGNRYLVTVALGAGVELGFAGGDGTGDLEGMGWCEVDAIRRTDSPQPGVDAGERVLVLDVRTMETVGQLPDVGT